MSNERKKRSKIVRQNDKKISLFPETNQLWIHRIDVIQHSLHYIELDKQPNIDFSLFLTLSRVGMITCLIDTPSSLILLRGLQQSSRFSSNHLQGAFQVLLGSIANALSTILILVNPQKAGSDWVLKSPKLPKSKNSKFYEYCSESLKKLKAVPSCRARWKYWIPGMKGKVKISCWDWTFWRGKRSCRRRR